MPQTSESRRRRPRREPTLQKRMREQRQSVYREAVNDAAERVFARKGTERSHMQEIAAEAGISLGTLYGVIEGKEALLRDIHRLRMREFLDCIRAARDAHEKTLTRHLAVLRDGSQFFLDRPYFLRMCSRDGYGWATALPGGAPGADLWEEGASIPRELFARGIAEGIYVDEDPDLLVRKMLALKQTELTYWADHTPGADPDTVLTSLETQFMRAFCRP